MRPGWRQEAVLTQSPAAPALRASRRDFAPCAALRELPARAEGGNVEDVCHAALDALDRADIPFAAIYRLNFDDRTARVALPEPATTESIGQ